MAVLGDPDQQSCLRIIFTAKIQLEKFYLSVSKAEKVLSTEIKGMEEVWGHSGDKLRE